MDMRKFEIREEDVIDIDNYIKERDNIKKEISILKKIDEFPLVLTQPFTLNVIRQ